MKFKNFIFQSSLTGFIITLIFNQIIFPSFQYKTGFKDFNHNGNDLDESWNIFIDCYGYNAMIDSSNYIYIMGAENYNSYWRTFWGDIIIIKYNSSGDQLWRINLDGFVVKYSRITVDLESNIYLASMFENQSLENEMVLLKFNSSGDLQWQKTWNGGDTGHVIDIDIDSENNIYIYGTMDLNKSFDVDLFIAKYDSSGDQIWFRQYEELNGVYVGRDIEIDSNKNLIVSGESFLQENENSSNYHWLRKYNQSGDLMWEIQNENDNFNTLKIDSLNNIFSISYYGLMKYNTSGNLLWNWENNKELWWQIYLEIDSFDNVYGASSISIPEDHHTTDLYVFKFNNTGNFEEQLTWGGSDDDYLRDICIDSNDNIYLLSDRILLKNPESNGKSLTNAKLMNFYIILFGICTIVSIISLIIILKRKER